MALQRFICGDFSFLFDEQGGHVRRVHVGDVEVLRGIYAAVRDQTWATIAPQLSELRITRGDTTLELNFTVACVAAHVDFVWHGRITVDATARQLDYQFNGHARRVFLKNRIGFCVLHAPQCSGQQVHVKTINGEVRRSTFPSAISPHQPFTEVRSLTHWPLAGQVVEVEMTGDIFEMEDQRNWTDASFKTYCTPLARTYPLETKIDETISQNVSLHVKRESSAHTSAALPAAAPSFPLSASSASRGLPLPVIGFGLSTSPTLLTPEEQCLLANLQPAHLRVDLSGPIKSWAAAFTMAWQNAQLCNARLEVALFFSGSDPREEIATLTQIMATGGRHAAVARWLVFCRTEKVTSARWLTAARTALSALTPTAPFVGGTDANFVELNRARPTSNASDALSFSINPQVHAFDDLSLLETLPMQGETVRNARQFSGGKPVLVSPVTFRPRANAEVPEASIVLNLDRVAGNPDPRQRSAFGALWTLLSFKYLAEAGTAAITYFQASGPHGLFQSTIHSGARKANATTQPTCFPVWHIFRTLSDFIGGSIIPLSSTDPLKLDGLLLAHGSRRRLLVAYFEASTLAAPPLALIPADTNGRVIISDQATNAAPPTANIPSLSLVQWDWIESIASLPLS